MVGEGRVHAERMLETVEAGMVVLEADVVFGEGIGYAASGTLALDLALVVEAPGGEDRIRGSRERGEPRKRLFERQAGVYIGLLDAGKLDAVGAERGEERRPD